MRKRKIKRQFKNFRIYKDLYGKPCKSDWMGKVVFLIQMLVTFSGRCNRFFWDIRLKILMLPNFNMLFQRLPTKFFKSERFSRLPKVDHVTTVVKETEREGREENGLLSDEIFDCALGYRVFFSFFKRY